MAQGAEFHLCTGGFGRSSELLGRFAETVSFTLTSFSILRCKILASLFADMRLVAAVPAQASCTRGLDAALPSFSLTASYRAADRSPSVMVLSMMATAQKELYVVAPKPSGISAR